MHKLMSLNDTLPTRIESTILVQGEGDKVEEDAIQIIKNGCFISGTDF